MRISGSNLLVSNGKLALDAPGGTRDLNAVEREEVLGLFVKELDRLRSENDQMKSAAEKANQALTLWKLLTTVVAIVVAVGGGLLWAGGEWSAWKEIKAIHVDKTASGRDTYSHPEYLSYGDEVLLRNPDGLIYGKDIVPSSEKDLMMWKDVRSPYVRWTLERPN